MSSDEPVIGIEHRPETASAGWDFWWRSAAGDVVAVFHGFGGGGSGQPLAAWVKASMVEPTESSLEARARGPIERAHAVALARVAPAGVAGGTMACVAFGEGRAAIAHVGDARVYALTSSGLVLLTRDHTLSQSDDPELQKLRALHPEIDARLRAVGSEDRFAIDVREHTRSPGEVLVLCTPGVYEVFGDELGDRLALRRDAPSAILRHLQRHEPRRPAALAMIFAASELGAAARPVAPRTVPPERGFLIVLHAPNEALVRRRYPLGPTVTTIGRLADNDIALEEDAVSRHHARIERRADGWWLVDQSTNGSFANDQRVQEARLRFGDHVQVGRTILLLSATEEFEIVETTFTRFPIDGLTGAYTRHHLDAQIARELERARNAARPLALVRLDIVRFKRINDAHGHSAGDEVLREVTRIATRHLRPGDVLARYAGDELALLLPDTDRHGAEALAGALRAELAVHAFEVPGATIRGVTVSVGVAQAGDATRTAEDLLRAAAPTR